MALLLWILYFFIIRILFSFLHPLQSLPTTFPHSSKNGILDIYTDYITPITKPTQWLPIAVKIESKTHISHQALNLSRPFSWQPFHMLFPQFEMLSKSRDSSSFPIIAQKKSIFTWSILLQKKDLSDSVICSASLCMPLSQLRFSSAGICKRNSKVSVEWVFFGGCI